MAKCQRCGKFLIFATKSGYCRSCEEFVRKEKEQLDAAERQRQKEQKLQEQQRQIKKQQREMEFQRSIDAYKEQERKRKLEEQHWLEEQRRIEEQRKKEEQRQLVEQRRLEEQARMEEQRRLQEERAKRTAQQVLEERANSDGIAIYDNLTCPICGSHLFGKTAAEKEGLYVCCGIKGNDLDNYCGHMMCYCKKRKKILDESRFGFRNDAYECKECGTVCWPITDEVKARKTLKNMSDKLDVMIERIHRSR